MSRRFTAVFLLVILLLAGVASYYASADPDGLEYVAEKTGFLDTAEDSAVSDSPLADYQTSGIENSRVSGGVAGVMGVALVLAAAGGLSWLVRRRPSDEAATAAEHQRGTR